MRKDDWIRVKHMLEAAQEALSFVHKKTKEDLKKDRQLTLSIIKEVEIIGEAANKVNNELRNQYPQIPWLDIINMRNHLIHVYFEIDLDIVWDTVAQDLPSLTKQLEDLLRIEKID